MLVGSDPEGQLRREQIVGDAHLVAVGVGARTPAASRAALSSRTGRRAVCPVADDRVTSAARPLMPSPLRSSGSSSASSVSSGMASTSPAPKSGIGTRRAMTFASAGIDGWQRGSGPRTDGTASRAACRRARRRRILPSRSRRRRALPRWADAADGRHVVADRAARAVERRSQSFFRGFHLEEIVEPEPESLELDRRDPRQRLAGVGAATLRDGTWHAASPAVTPQTRADARPSARR